MDLSKIFSALKRGAKPVCRLGNSVIAFVKRHMAASVSVAAVFVMVMMMSFMVLTVNDVTVYEDGVLTMSFRSAMSDSDAILKQKEIEVSSADITEVVKSGRDIDIYIQRAFDVTIEADGASTTIKTTACTVESALEKAGITLAEADRVTPDLGEAVTAGSTLTVTRVTQETVTVTEAIAYETVTKNSSSLYQGQSKVSQEGKDGQKEINYLVTYENGVETGRELVSETVTTESTPKIILKGTKQKAVEVVSNSKTAPTSYKKVIRMNASAYTYGDDGGNITATGQQTRRGLVAVDPDVIPLGTKLYIETADGKYIYGTAVAADTGGAIKGNKIDLFMESYQECINFGRRDVNVYIL